MTNELAKTEAGQPAPVEDAPLDQNPAQVYLGGLAESGQRSQTHALRVIADIIQGNEDYLSVPWKAIRYQHVARIQRLLVERGYSPATVHRTMAALRGTLKEAWRLGLISSDDYHRAIDIEPVRYKRLQSGRLLDTSEIAALIAITKLDKTTGGARDAALLAVLYAGLARRTEAVNLDLSDYDPGTGKLTIRGGKGNKDRETFINPGARRAVNHWLELRGNAPGALFHPVYINAIKRRRMTAQAVYSVLKRRGEQAGLKPFTPHDLRRSGITHLLAAGGDVFTVQKLAGHENPNTTTSYDYRPIEAMREAAELLTFPY